MQSSILILIPVSLFAGGFIVLLRGYRISKRRESLATKRYEEIRKKFQQEVGEVDSVINTLLGLHDAGYEHSTIKTKESIAQAVIDAACQITQTSAGSLLILDKDGNELALLATKGMALDKFPAKLKLGEGISGRAAESGKMIVIDDVETDPRFVRTKGIEFPAKSLVSYPLKIRNRVIGVLNVYAPEAYRQFSEREIRLLGILASQSAITLENWELHDNLQRFYLEMIETLARVLDVKENVNRSREMFERIRTHTRKIAEELNLPESIARNIEFAALMHGIGKIGIDDEILRKPGRLTEEEYNQVKKHPELGKEMISRVQFLSPVTSMILYHQERWDGKGYPAGLKGEEIPLGSRIVAVINAYEAMVSDRPYRKALTEAEAIGEMQRGAGTQFDPKIVEAFVLVLEKSKGNKSENSPKLSRIQSEPLRKWNG